MPEAFSTSAKNCDLQAGPTQQIHQWSIFDFSSLMRNLVGCDYESWWIPLYWICGGLPRHSCDICLRWLYSLNDELPSKKTVANKSLRSCFYLCLKTSLGAQPFSMEMRISFMFIVWEIKVISIWKVLHQKLFWKRLKNYRAQTSNERFNVHKLPSISFMIGRIRTPAYHCNSVHDLLNTVESPVCLPHKDVHLDTLVFAYQRYIAQNIVSSLSTVEMMKVLGLQGILTAEIYRLELVTQKRENVLFVGILTRNI